MSLKTILKNPGLKLLSLLIAILLWFHSVTERTYVTDFSIPVQFQGIPDTLFVINELPQKIKVALRGRGKDLLFFSLTKPKITITLRELKPGRRTLTLSPEYLDLPHRENINTLYVEPDKITLAVDKLASRRVKVSASVKGIPKKGYTFVEAIEKGRVYLYGPSQIIRDYKVIKTENIDISEQFENFETFVKLVPPHEMTYLKPESAKVLVKIEPAEEIVFEDIPIKIKGLPTNKVKLVPDKLKVVCTVPQSKIKKVRGNFFDVTIDLGGLESGEYRVKPSVNLKSRSPSWVKIMEFNPKEILAKIQE